MGFLVAILVLVLIVLVVLVVSAPLRRARGGGSRARRADGVATGAPAVESGEAAIPSPSHAGDELQVRDELEAAREAKYREIRDTELDYRTGKLSREDYQAIDADLRAEAIEILDRLERLRPREP